MIGYRLMGLLMGVLALTMIVPALAMTPTRAAMPVPAVSTISCMTQRTMMQEWTVPTPPRPLVKPTPKATPKPPEGHLMTVGATAYALYGTTSRGTRVCPGTIAVDPRVIPYGSKIYVPGYGWGTALDCGGAIIGRRIDLWMPTNSQCFAWGMREVTIRVIPPQH